MVYVLYGHMMEGAFMMRSAAMLLWFEEEGDIDVVTCLSGNIRYARCAENGWLRAWQVTITVQL